MPASLLIILAIAKVGIPVFDFDSLSYSNRWSQRPPEGKAFLGFSAIVLSMVLSFYWVHGLIVGLLAYLTVVRAGIPLKRFLGFYTIPLTFLLLAALTLLFSISTTSEGFIWHFAFGRYFFGISAGGLSQVGPIASRCVSTLTALYFLVLTIPIQQMVRLLKRCRVPIFLIELFVMMYRFINVFVTSVVESYQILQLRNGFSTYKTSIRSLSLLVVMTYERMILHYEDWQLALQTKNFNGDFHI